MLEQSPSVSNELPIRLLILEMAKYWALWIVVVVLLVLVQIIFIRRYIHPPTVEVLSANGPQLFLSRENKL